MTKSANLSKLRKFSSFAFTDTAVAREDLVPILEGEMPRARAGQGRTRHLPSQLASSMTQTKQTIKLSKSHPRRKHSIFDEELSSLDKVTVNHHIMQDQNLETPAEVAVCVQQCSNSISPPSLSTPDTESLEHTYTNKPHPPPSKPTANLTKTQPPTNEVEDPNIGISSQKGSLSSVPRYFSLSFT